MSDYGWSKHLDKTGTPCAYCGESSTRTLVVEPDQYGNGELKKRGKRVGLCDNCEPATSEDPAQSVTFRRRGIKDVEQLGFDVGDQRGGSAIRGNEAA